MRFHVLGMPHTKFTTDYSWCAFTDRTRTFIDMMRSSGHEVFSYGGELVTDEERAAWFPWWNPATTAFNSFDPNSHHWTEFNRRCVEAIRANARDGDILCITMGASQWPVAQALPSLLPVETGIGYSGVVAPFRVFESHAWRAFLGAKEATDDVRLYDTVIPRAWDITDFPAGSGDGGYALYVGRVIHRKGVQIAIEATERAGIPLVIAGQYDPATGPNTDFPHVRMVGVVGPEERATLMGGAACLFSPSMYFEPLGGVHIEAQLTGTPVITTDWGVYPETVLNGVNGLRCNTLREFSGAVAEVAKYDRDGIRERAQARWGTAPVTEQFNEYFDRLSTLRRGGWYAY